MLARIRLKEGSGIPLVFLHGFLGSSADWIPLCSHLPPCDCYGIDLPGHGASPYTEQFFEEMPFFPRMHLIGYSMGGRLAMQYAERHPERIASLFILSAHPGLESEEAKAKKRLFYEKWAKTLLEQPIDDFLKRWYDQPIFGGFTPDLTMRRKQDPKQLSQVLLKYNLTHQAFLQPKNATFIVGDRDAEYLSLFPEAKVIPGAAHLVHLENPQAVAKIIEQRIFS